MNALVRQFSCSCPTVAVARRYVAGAATLAELRDAIQYHENHACPDFTTVYEMLCDELMLANINVQK